MKKLLFASLLAFGSAAVFAEECDSCTGKKSDECGSTCQKASEGKTEHLYAELAKRSKKIDTDCEEQKGALKDVLKEVTAIVDECNCKLEKSLTKYQELENLQLHGNLTLNLSVDQGE